METRCENCGDDGFQYCELTRWTLNPNKMVPCYCNEGSPALSFEEQRAEQKQECLERSRKGIVDPIYIGVMGRGRIYLGPEEGGRWADSCQLLEMHRAYTWQNAHQMIVELRKNFPKSKYGRGSVLGGTDYEFVLARSTDFLENLEYYPSHQYE